MKTLAMLVALIGLAACSNSEELAVSSGPVFALNVGHWQPTTADLQIPKLGKAE